MSQFGPERKAQHGTAETRSETEEGAGQLSPEALIEDAGTDKPKAQHVADILRRYIKRKILRQRRQQKS